MEHGIIVAVLVIYFNTNCQATKARLLNIETSGVWLPCLHIIIQKRDISNEDVGVAGCHLVATFNSEAALATDS